MKSDKIIERLYPEVEPPKALQAKCKKSKLKLFGRKGWRAASRAARGATILLVAGGAWAVVHLYYYNRLISLEFDVMAAWAQVETQLQRRHHIQENLTRMVLDYAAHEREVLTNITKLRSSTPAPVPAAAPVTPPLAMPDAAGALASLSEKDLQKLFARILVVAEQYPQLKLSENFQQFSGAIIETETAIATRTSEYNDVVNIYTTEISQFPGNFFAWAFGFESRDFYHPKEEALEFKGVSY